MPSKADMEGWFRAIEQNLKDNRIVQLNDFSKEIIKKVERHGGELYFFFQSGKWAKISIGDDWGDAAVVLDGEISIHYEITEFLSGDIVTKYIVETATKYNQELNQIAYEEKDRKEWERLRRKFGNDE